MTPSPRTPQTHRTPRIVVVTGTDTGVGKTVATAALAAAARARGERVLMVKPVQTGIDPAAPDPEVPDVEEVRRLAGCEVAEFVRLRAPLAPDTAARQEGARLPDVATHAERIHALAAGVDTGYDTVIVEGAGGLLVYLDAEGATLADLVVLLGSRRADETHPPDVDVVIVARAALGTLNHTALTVEALRSRGIEPAGIVIGSWPDQSGLAERSNLTDLPRACAVPLWGRIPAGASGLAPEDFRAAAPAWF